MIDGMNLVAKEYVASQDAADPGVLILSKFAGAAEQLQDALLVNPYDPNDMVQALRSALEMPLDERVARHKKLAKDVNESDSKKWSNSFFASLVKAGKRRMGRTQPSARVSEAMRRLGAVSKKRQALSRS